MSKVLVLTNSLDLPHVQVIEHHLNQRGHDLVRLDVDLVLRGEQSVTWDYQANSLRLRTEDGSVELLDVDSVWFRKPFGFGANFGFAETIRDPVQRMMVEKEARDIVEGLCAVLQSKRWINHPHQINQARLKPYQLHLAWSLAMKMPDSIITSDPDEARAFCAKGPTVFKALATQALDYDEVVSTIDTTLITDELLPKLDFIRAQPILLQRCIDKSAELRVTCVGRELFVAKQTLSAPSDEVDWRSLQDSDISTYERSEVSPELEFQILQMMSLLDLKFAAMDFAVDHQGQPWFLEVNPNGQWLGYTDSIGMPAAAAMARLLVP